MSCISAVVARCTATVQAGQGIEHKQAPRGAFESHGKHGVWVLLFLGFERGLCGVSSSRMLSLAVRELPMKGARLYGEVHCLGRRVIYII